MFKISKEVLSSVIGKEIKEFIIEKNELRYILEGDVNPIPDLIYINIYELAFKYKQWALKQIIDNNPKNNPFKYKVLDNLDILIYKHPIEEGYVSQISPLFYSDDINLSNFGINLRTYNETIINNSFSSLYFYADTEVEAIIKACEWIFKEIK